MYFNFGVKLLEEIEVFKRMERDKWRGFFWKNNGFCGVYNNFID